MGDGAALAGATGHSPDLGADPGPADAIWPAVTDPAALLTEIAGWLHGYGNRNTRRTYAEGLGLPVTAPALREWADTPDMPPMWTGALARYAAALGITDLAATERPTGRGGPPPAARGRLRTMHWFRWCASHRLDPLLAETTHVKVWLDALATAGAASATRDRMLATLKALYSYLAESGLTTGNPAALNRRRLGLRSTGRASGTVTLTITQVNALLEAAGHGGRGVRPIMAARARAVVALFTLGLRVTELCELDRTDLHVTRGRKALRVTGKGDKTRIVYLSEPADAALSAYLRARDAAEGDTTVTRTGQAGGGTARVPLIATGTGGRCSRQSLWALLRRIARTADGPLADIADSLHPHALRHFYVTTAVEAGAQLVHVQADVGHTSIDTTEGVYNAAARDPSRSAVDVVADALNS